MARSVYQVDTSDPPLLIMRGDHDYQVPINQSLELEWAYEKNDLKVQLEVLEPTN